MTAITFAQAQSFAVPQRPTLLGRFSIIIANVLVVGFVVALGAWYLVQVNVTMAKGYRITDAQKKIAALETVARSNQVKLTELETVSNLSAQAVSLGMVPVGTVEYVSRPSGGVAIR